MYEFFFQGLVCIIIADFLSGLGHWFEDTYGLPSWPILGKLIIEDNIHHHRAPGEMASTVFQRNYIPLGLSACIALLCYLCGVFHWQIGVILLALGLSNETHAWCHGLGRNWLVILLQDMGLVISPIQHGHHHRSPFNKTFCTITNWCNPILDRINFWGGIEWVISLTGIKPKRLSQERAYL